MALFTAIGTALGASAASAFTTGLGVSALAAGAVGYSMYSSDQQMRQAKAAQSGAQMPITPAPAVPTQDDAAKIAAERAENMRRSMARSESVYTNPLGLKDEAEVARKKLLGG